MEATLDEIRVVGQFSIEFTWFIAFWNQAEATSRRILQLMLGESETAMALSVEMQNRSLANAIRAGAKDPRFVHIRGELEHLIDGYEILLEHRNYHVHSLLGMDGNGGLHLSVSAKGRLKMDKAVSTVADMTKLKNHSSDWIGFASAIELELGASGDGLVSLIEVYEASLEKPIWPAKVKKNPLFLQVP